MRRKVAGKNIILGTATWGWKTAKEAAHELARRFTGEGFGLFDTATNYPIDGNIANEGLALDWLGELYEADALPPASIYVKVGAADNSGRELFDLGPEAFERKWLVLVQKLRPAIYGIGVHFDPRKGHSMFPEVGATISILESLYDSGVRVGFSGVKDPKLYSKASPSLADKWIIQVRENIVTDQARANYTSFFPRATFWTYGINQSGYVPSAPMGLQPPRARSVANLRVGASKLNLAIKTLRGHGVDVRGFHQLTLLYALLNPETHGIILGPRTVDQLVNSMEFFSAKEEFLSTLSQTQLRELSNLIRKHFR